MIRIGFLAPSKQFNFLIANCISESSEAIKQAN